MYFKELARRPICPESPSGKNPNDIDDFVELKRQINKISTVTGRVNWPKIHSLSENILIMDSKDFRCASYYCVASAHVNGLKGLVEGLNALLDLSIIYWFSAYPDFEKPKARVQAIDWMVEHVVKKQTTYKVCENDLMLIESGHRLALKLEEELKKQLGKDAPSLGPVRRIFSGWIDEISAKNERKKEADKTKIAATPKPSIVMPKIPEVEIKINSNKNCKNQKTDEESSKKQSVPAWVYLLLSLILIISLYFITLKVRVNHYESTIVQANEKQFLTALSQLENAHSDLQSETKDTVLKKSESLLASWAEDPKKINVSPTLNVIINKVVKIYPDSSKAHQLNNQFKRTEKALLKEYALLFKQFRKARSAIANLYQTNISSEKESANVNIAYKYSNTLFPLLGRFEHMEQSKLNKETIDKTQRLLNVYQYKLIKAKEELNQ